MTKMPLRAAAAAGAHYPLKQGQSRLFHRLPSGLRMEVIVQKRLHESQSDPDSGQNSNPNPNPNPPLVFVHGSFHAAWCWAEHWMPFFSRCGYDCYAVSLLGQGESDTPTGAAAAARDDLPPWLGGAVLICSVPPSGNSGLVWRYLLTKPVAAIKVTLSLAAKAFTNSLPLCKETFFSSTMDDHLVQRYQKLMSESSKIPLFDLKKLNTSLPVPSIPKDSVRVLVIGASDDFIVDEEGLCETAKFYDVQAVSIQGVAHDMMLDSSWEKGAEMILSWINTSIKKPKQPIAI